MALFDNVIVCVYYVLLLLVHIPTVFCPGRAGQVTAWLNIALHLALMPPLALVVSAGIEEAVLLYMISVFVLVALTCLRDALAKRRAARAAAEAAASAEENEHKEERFV